MTPHRRRTGIGTLIWKGADTPCLQFPSLPADGGLVHGIFTRRGGASRAPYNSLNTSYAVGDRPSRVDENLAKILGAFHARRLVYMHQVHGVGMEVIRDDRPGTPAAVPQADALITDAPRTLLMVKQADCQAVIFHDPVRHVAAVAHCGWRGNVQNIVGRVVWRMAAEFGCRGADIRAAVGPSLGPCCAEFQTHQEIFPPEFEKFMVRENHFDLWALSRTQLRDAGLDEAHIHIAGICTRCRTDLFYSYRGEGVTGRFGTVAMLEG